MKLRYTVNNEHQHYIEISLSKATKSARVEYRNGSTGEERVAEGDLSNVLDSFPDRDPIVQVFRKEEMFDLHISKISPSGQEIKEIIELDLPEDLNITELILTNDQVADAVLGDYITQPLELYDRASEIDENEEDEEEDPE